MMERNPRAGLLPLYLGLYDDAMPERRKEFEPFLNQVQYGLTDQGINVVKSDICRTAEEFAAAVALFEKRDVDCIVTLHLAYSPSLEAVEALVNTDIPLLLLDTTMDARFGQDVDPERIMYNHGIHGVMDLASMLRRQKRPFRIVAGHVEGGALDRAALSVRGAFAARRLRSTRSLRVGESFKGMGDFSVESAVMASVLGIHVDQVTSADLAPDVEAITDAEVQAELEADRARFVCEVPDDVHARSVRVGLGVRRRLETGDYSAFSMNFLAFDSGDGPVNVMPFLEASKAMARGIGYGGEGDVLTAALVGALARGFGDTTFTEIFCSDWDGNSLFLSHMGEINPDLAAAKPVLIEKPFPWTAARNPAVLTCAPRQGPGVFVNLVPGPDDTFNLVVAPVHVLEDTH